MLLWVLGFSLIGGIGGVAGTAVILAFPQALQTRLLPHLLSYGTGTLLGAAFLGLFPHALESTSPEPIMLAALFGVLFFFMLEKVMLWRDCHDPGCEIHSHAGSFILVGDAIHNGMDGMVIGTAFLVSVPLGIATGLAVLAHELPQEIGDYAILVESGMSRGRAFVTNLIASGTTVPGALAAYFGLRGIESFIPYMLAFAGASFIYVATGHLIPTLHKRQGMRASLQQLVLIVAGVLTIALLHQHEA